MEEGFDVWRRSVVGVDVEARRRPSYPAGSLSRLRVELAVAMERPLDEIEAVGRHGARDRRRRSWRNVPDVKGVEIEGMTETLKAVRGIKDGLERKETNKQLRAAARVCATSLAGDLDDCRACVRCPGRAPGRRVDPGQE